MQIDRLVIQAQALTAELQVTVDRIAETLRTHETVMNGGSDEH